MKKMMKRIVSLFAAAAMTAGLLAGCGGGNGANSASVANPALTMDQGVVSMDEAKLYTYVMKSQYEYYYGSEIWEMEKESGVTFADSVKEMIEKELVRVTLLSSMADEYNVSLSGDDKTAVDEYIESFKTNVGEDVMTREGITEEAIRGVVEKSTLAGYVYQAMMEKEVVEVSDEEKAEAECIKVQHILISTTDTVKTDEEGNTVDMTDEEAEAYRNSQKTLAESVLAKAQNGEDFQELANEYSAENAGFEFSFDKNGYDPINYSYMVEPFYTAAWKLGEGEISGLVESDYGYHIIKCISLHDEEATQAAIDVIEDDLQYESVNNKMTQMVEDAVYTVSDEWKNFKITASVTEETAGETDTAGESPSETETGTDAETATETQTSTETESGGES